ncbi:putative bifunctional diguanylate cyclase/phosphodiesterase [Kineococcus endophyticus]|uniref:putative bifunctional diguanylate cyclase/phosphodiesterase n=1 Tax=Kineococcus endophyticus TaxID=1181883 RepID=UPI003464165F
MLSVLLLAALAQVPLALTGGGAWPTVRFALALVAVTATWRVLVWRARRATAEGLVWRLFSWGCFLYGVGAVSTAAVAAVPGLQPYTDVPNAVCAALTFPLAYRALVRWSRRSAGVDPDDLLNGVSAVLVVAALVGVGVALRAGDGVDSGLLGSASWREQLLVLQDACVFILLGAALTAAFTARLHRDVRIWLVFAAYCLAGAGGVAALVDGGTRPTWALPLWAAGLVALAAAAVLEARFEPTQTSDPVKSTVGSFVVVAAGLAVATVVLLAGAPRGLALCALLGVLGSSVRLLVNLFELAQLAVSRREALTDDLTGIANRRALVRHLDEVLAHRAATTEGPTAGVQVLVFDLDHFKEVNDSLGHGAGDGLLQMLTQRIAPELPASAVFARLGGDEFVVVSDDGVPGDRVLAVLDGAQREPFPVGGVSVHADLSVGRATWEASPAASGPVVDATVLLRRADTAMYDAKRTGRAVGGSVVTYDPDRHGDTHGLLSTVAELRHGIAAGQLRVHFQPQLHSGDGTLSGVEALVRWQHPVRGLLAPGEFLDVAESHGLMDAVTQEVLRQSVAQQAAWRRRGLVVRMSVNLSAGTLLDASLPETVAALLARHDVPATSLVLEVTETALLREPERSLAVVEALGALGVQGSIDDFGTGYSSLTQLRQLPVSELKLDRSFTADLLSDPRAAAIVAHTVGLAHALQLRVVAEGVEDEETLAALTGLGCDETQGFLHARPLPAPEFEAWCAAREGAVPGPRSPVSAG